MSLDQDLGALTRRVTQDIPACGTAPTGTDIFGLLYGGAVHTADIAFWPDDPTGSVDVNHPISRGTALFVRAYNSWVPCLMQAEPNPIAGVVAAAGTAMNPAPQGPWGFLPVGKER